MMRYEFTPGIAARAPEKLAAPSTASKGDLFLFIHPQCTCSRATIAELSRIVALSKESLHTCLYFYQPLDKPKSWCYDSALWHEAKLIPGALLIVDSDARIAKQFGVQCSGQVLLYGSKGHRLLFAGGITPGRGHEGESDGEDAILEYVRTEICPIHTAPVFGCALWSDLDVKAGTL